MKSGRGSGGAGQQWHWRAALVAAALAVSACGKSVPPPAVYPDQAQEYRIGREDVLEVSVWRDADLTRMVPVRPDGKISLPLLGELTAQGKTAAELALEIQQKLTPYVESPKVAIIVREVNAPRFNVLGEVQKPGIFPLRGNVSVLQALAQAGGFNPFADQDGLVIVRQSGGRTQRFTVRYSDLIANDGAAIFLDAGDTLYVP